MEHLYLLAFFVAIHVSNAYGQKRPEVMLEDGLVGFWSFEGDINDYSKNRNVGTVTNGIITRDRNGKQNSAVHFNSSMASEVRLNSPYPIYDEFSISMWVKPGRRINLISPSSPCSGVNRVPMAHSNQNWALYPVHGGDWDLGVGFSIGTNGISIAEHASNILVSQLTFTQDFDAFTHILITYGAYGIDLYVNGNYVASAKITCSYLSRKIGSPILLAHELYSSGFDGVIDDFGIWERVLSSSEIKSLFMSQPAKFNNPSQLSQPLQIPIQEKPSKSIASGLM